MDNNRYVVSYRNSTSNHNHMTIVLYFYGLYLIEILHQTTTICFHDIFSSLLYLIEILHQTTTEDWGSIKKHWLYLIEILHQTTTAAAVFKIAKGCILSKFYIKPQLRLERELARCSCILSKFYIKPQQIVRALIVQIVVSYRNSTSNHNTGLINGFLGQVVSYRNSTSNHNSAFATKSAIPLYLIEILHQTTT